MHNELQEKYEKLKQNLQERKKVAVAYSGGVDSTFLLKTARDVLGENVIAMTMKLHSFPRYEYEECMDFCRRENIFQIVLEFDELKIPGFTCNPENRCYLCKKELFSKMKECAAQHGNAILVEGSNVDDMGDYRPGMQAIKELSIESPLKDVGLSKQDIRDLSKILGLPTWKKPSFACLSTRFPYGETISVEKLQRVEAAENILFQYGITQARVRCHNDLARIELLPEDFSVIMETSVRKNVVTALKTLGFSYVSLDLQGYRTGSMNEGLKF